MLPMFQRVILFNSFLSLAGTIIRPSRSSHNLEKGDRGGPASLFPAKTVDLLKNRLKFFDLIFNGGELNEEEKARGKFIILCETFLQMYKARRTAFEFGRAFLQKLNCYSANVFQFSHRCWTGVKWYVFRRNAPTYES